MVFLYFIVFEIYWFVHSQVMNVSHPNTGWINKFYLCTLCADIFKLKTMETSFLSITIHSVSFPYYETTSPKHVCKYVHNYVMFFIYHVLLSFMKASFVPINRPARFYLSILPNTAYKLSDLNWAWFLTACWNKDHLFRT